MVLNVPERNRAPKLCGVNGRNATRGGCLVRNLVELVPGNDPLNATRAIKTAVLNTPSRILHTTGSANRR
eukprot:771125-Lingulodinium_polyedra.AAC.1